MITHRVKYKIEFLPHAKHKDGVKNEMQKVKRLEENPEWCFMKLE